MKDIRRLEMIVCLLMLAAIAKAQSISGKLVDEKQQAVAYANIVLQQADSTFVAGTTSDEKGSFNLAAPKAGNYLLQVSCIGYESQTVRLEGLDRKRNLGTLVLGEASELLDEVNVTANAIVKKVDRQIVYPSEKQLRQSSSGYDLLANLMLPDLQINIAENKVSTIGGGSVELRINDLKASATQVSALRPSEVVRVEYIDNPGVRYGDTNVEAVINYIVKRSSAGVNGGISGMNAFTTGFGNDNVYVNANVGKSQFGVDYFVSYRDYDHRHTNSRDVFNFPNGETHERRSIGIDVPFGYVQQVIEASYNLTETDKYVFNVVFTNEMYDTDKQDHSQRIVETGRKDITFFKHGEDHSSTPSLDLYFSRNLPNKQKITANVVGTYIGTDYLYDYRDYEDEETPLSHYNYTTDGNRYSLIGEGIYSKEWEKITLSAGVKGNMAYTKNIYEGDNNQALHMHNSSLYGYLQLQGKWRKLNYMIGAGVQRQAFSQAENSYAFTTLRPSLSLSHPLFKNTSLRYRFTIQPSVPSLSQLSDVTRQSNDLSVSRGNRSLKPYRLYANRLTFAWNTPRFSTQLNADYIYYHKPIMQTINPVQNDDGSYLIEYASENGKSHRSFTSTLSLQWKVLPDFLTLSGYGGYGWYRSVGSDYEGEYTAWTGGITLNASYKNFSLYTSMSVRPKSLYGHYVNYGEKNSTMQLTYQPTKNLTVGAICLYPFLSEGWTGKNRIMHSPYLEKNETTYIKDNGNMFCLYANWKFSYGRKHQAGKKTLNNSDRDSGIAK